MSAKSARDASKSIPAPAGYVRFLLRRFGTTAELRARLVEGTDIDEERLKSPDNEVTLFTFITFSENLCRIVGEQWPLDAAPAWSTSMQGALEVAVRSAPTVGDGMEVLWRFGHVRAPFLTIGLKAGRAQRRLLLLPGVALSPVGWRALSTISMLGVAAMMGVVLEDALQQIEFCFPWPAPDHVGRLRSAIGGTVRFAERDCAVIVPEALAAQASPFADTGLYASALQELEQASRRVAGEDTMLMQVERLFQRHRTGRLSEEEAALALGLSRRTLVRRLAGYGTSYRALLDADLKQRAQLVLAEGKLSRDQMASRLGFKDPTSFSRACRRWFGAESPK